MAQASTAKQTGEGQVAGAGCGCWVLGAAKAKARRARVMNAVLGLSFERTLH
jgi:hypothetical protein